MELRRGTHIGLYRTPANLYSPQISTVKRIYRSHSKAATIKFGVPQQAAHSIVSVR